VQPEWGQRADQREGRQPCRFDGSGGARVGGDGGGELVILKKRHRKKVYGRAANYTARSNIEPAQSFPHANGQAN